MNQAVINIEFVVRRSEICYCSTPVEHECATVHDRHFTDIETKRFEDYVELEGETFMACLEALDARSGTTGRE